MLSKQTIPYYNKHIRQQTYK